MPEKRCQSGACTAEPEGFYPEEESVCTRCKVHCSYAGTQEEAITEEDLAVSLGGWCGPRRERLSTSVARRVQAYLQARSAVLHLDELINKKDPLQVGYLLQRLLLHQSPVQVAFLQGAIPLQNSATFARLLEFLEQCPVWSVNLGELRFSEEQCVRLAESLRKSGVTHM